MCAAKFAQMDVLRWLVEDGGASMHVVSSDGSTVWDWAVLGGNLDIIKYVAARAPDLVPRVNNYNCRAVPWAAAGGDIDVLRWLQNEARLDMNHVNDSKHGAVNKAAWKGHRVALEWLLVDPQGPALRSQLFLLDNEGRTVSQLARIGAQHAIADWLDQLAASPV
jgi:ankyrin repeat protein